MPSDDSVTQWLGQLQERDPAAAQKLFDHYWSELVAFARGKLGNTPRRVADEEDLALSAFASFCRCATDGRMPQLQDRGDLRHFLLVLTARKVSGQRRYLSAKRRRPEDLTGASLEAVGQVQPMAPEPTPEFAAQMVEEYQRLLQLFPDEGLRAVAQAKLEGYTNEEIAAKLDCALATVERRLKTIRKLWEAEIADES